MSEKKPACPDPSRARALGHDVRRRIFETLQSRAATPAELAREMDLTLEQAAYHTAVLVDSGCIERLQRRPREGTLENLYVAAAASWRSCSRPSP
ncbi:MAG TPA: helix-turn-helix domain-containing protein [Solirubrobacterales bacterium]|nr:helix-turn-helix domain-containing protein [Solirubrobacterales bacterium]